nr:lipoyltransferase 1, mitochondrial-like [Ciona intestinalis]|eukprot:XP_002129038.1 lipoyltransferase 1, mitochondrial-like [Ciona intestinalis]
MLLRCMSNYYVLLNGIRCFSSKQCIVYTTSVTDPFYNLAFEEWMFRKVDFTKTNCLFIWRSQPSVVIGRHQNPWKECRVNDTISDEINLCRRSSGGGAVYHDLGNLNFTFFNEKSEYNTKRNLKLITRGLRETWPFLDVDVNRRDDIILNKRYKISGTAARLGRRSCYHHCTLLVSTNKSNLTKYLHPNKLNLTSIATDSVRSTVRNLSDEDNTINCKNVSNAVTQVYVRQFSGAKYYEIDTKSEQLLTGVTEIAKELLQWEWVYGKTPKFTYEFDYYHEKSEQTFPITLEVKEGIVSNITVQGDEIPFSMESFIGKKFSP